MDHDVRLKVTTVDEASEERDGEEADRGNVDRDELVGEPAALFKGLQTVLLVACV